MQRALAPGLLFLAVVALYAPSLGAGFLYDDHEVIVVQPRPQGPAELLRVFAEPHFRGLPYYRPVTRASLLAQKGLHGDRPGAFRAVNALLMAAAALLAFGLLRTRSLAIERTPALLAAALFAVHPAASSCVYPIASGRETLLPAVLMLAAVLAWVRARRAWALLGLGLALFAKEQAVVLPFLFVLADLCRVSEGTTPRGAGAWLRRYAPLLPVLALYAAARALVLGGGHLALAVDEAPLRPLLSYAYALQVAVAPFARLVYEPEVGVWLSAWRLGLAALVVAAALGARRRLGAPPWTLLAFWLGWFAVAQLPTANWLRQEAHFAERYTFLAFLAVPALAAQLVSVRWSRRPVRRATLAVAALAIALAAATSAGRAAYFRDDETFARQWLRTNPASPDAHHVLGVVRLLEGRPREAIPHLRTALAGAERSADIHANLGAALAMQGRDDEAAHHLEQALRIDPGHPEARRSLERLRARR